MACNRSVCAKACTREAEVFIARIRNYCDEYLNTVNQKTELQRESGSDCVLADVECDCIDMMASIRQWTSKVDVDLSHFWNHLADYRCDECPAAVAVGAKFAQINLEEPSSIHE